jgi:hypothetical protein
MKGKKKEKEVKECGMKNKNCMLTKKIKILLVFILAQILWSISYAHKIEHVRTLKLYVGEDKITLTIIFRVPPGKKAFELRKRADLNKDDFIDYEELKIIKNILSFEATKGISIRFQEKPVNIKVMRVNLETARESYSSLEITAFVEVAIWLAPAPPPPYFKIGIVEREYSHTHIIVETPFRIKKVKGKIEIDDEGRYVGEIERFSPLILIFER